MDFAAIPSQANFIVCNVKDFLVQEIINLL